MDKRDVVIIGGGPAGLAAAVELRKQGIHDVIIIEREKQLGGILRQCIHDGFGLTRFGESLSGPEYSQRFIDSVKEGEIEYITNATVISLTEDKVVTFVRPAGIDTVEAKAVILAMGCRERTRGALAIPGSRPAGIYSAGVAQSYVNLFNTMVGKEIIIMGSGDIGMIMARRMTLEGAHVKAVFEIQHYPSGLPRNIEQCLNDYHIPLYLGRSVVDIKGETRIVGVTVADFDEKMRPIPGTEEFFSCDTLILSVGLIPENELSIEAGVLLDEGTRGAVVDENYQTNISGIFSAGNVLHVHDLVDFVSQESERLARGAARYVKIGRLPCCRTGVSPGAGIGHVIPQRISGEEDVVFSMRVKKPMKKCRVSIRQGKEEVKSMTLPRANPAEMIELCVGSEKIKSEEMVEVTAYES